MVLRKVSSLPTWGKSANFSGVDNMEINERGGCKSDDSKSDNPDDDKNLRDSPGSESEVSSLKEEHQDQGR